MNDEIKEIKVNKSNKSITLINNGIAFSQFGIADEILDLITNLQQENERLKELKDTYKEQCRITHNDLETYIRKYECLQEENRGIRKAFIGLQKELNEDYKSRCEKAIEYMKQHEKDGTLWLVKSTDDLLNILQNGSENDE